VSGREEYIAGLRELADFLEAHPALPVERYPTPRRVHTGPDTGTTGDGVGRAIVDDAAAILGVTARATPGGHYEAARTFSGGISYGVVCIPAAAMAEHEARSSYSGNVQTGGAR
jgi:hypothetical protein